MKLWKDISNQNMLRHMRHCCVVQFDEEAGSELWNYYFMDAYESIWNSITNRDIFENVIEF